MSNINCEDRKIRASFTDKEYSTIVEYQSRVGESITVTDCNPFSEGSEPRLMGFVTSVKPVKGESGFYICNMEVCGYSLGKVSNKDVSAFTLVPIFNLVKGNLYLNSFFIERV
ncbi:MAG: hypothetical protein IBX57_00670 [Gammaproteobacteria bacterium]|nr:hypothetical protein [Gammaproteobacteria bacterium]